jgi:hypothetical protein
MSGPFRSRARELVQSGLLDIAAGVEDLTEDLTESVLNELNGFVSKWAVQGAIRRALVQRVNETAKRKCRFGEIR